VCGVREKEMNEEHADEIGQLHARYDDRLSLKDAEVRRKGGRQEAHARADHSSLSASG
jgi:hypothetical protein